MKSLKESVTTVGAIIIGAIISPNFVDFQKENYLINENKVVVSDVVFNDYLKEYKGEDEIKYVIGIGGIPSQVKINGTKYTSKDTLVYPEACKRYDFLRNEINSIENAKKESKLQEKFNEKIKDLEILKK